METHGQCVEESEDNNADCEEKFVALLQSSHQLLIFTGKNVLTHIIPSNYINSSIGMHVFKIIIHLNTTITNFVRLDDYRIHSPFGAGNIVDINK